MNAIPYDRPEEDWDKYEDDDDAGAQRLPGRPRRQFLTWASAALCAVVLCAVGFYAGVRVEKGQVSSSSTTTLGATGAGARAAGTGATAGRGATGSGARATGAASLFGGGGDAVAGAGGAFGAGNSTIGTVSSIDGSSLYVTDTSGNTVKVTLSSASKISRSVNVSKSAIRPGDTVVVRGLKSSDGTVSATTVSDTGAAASGFGGSGSSSSGSSSASSAASSLFGG
jgi:hypothetical protein